MNQPKVNLLELRARAERAIPRGQASQPPPGALSFLGLQLGAGRTLPCDVLPAT